MAGRKNPKADRDKITPLQMRWCEEYIIDMNARAAARRSGYTECTSASRANEFLRKPEVAAYVAELIEERSKRTRITADRVLQELALIAFSDLADYVEWDSTGVRLKDGKKLSSDYTKAVEMLAEGVNGVRIKMHDKMTALQHLGRHLGLFLDKVALTDPSGEKPYSPGTMTDAQRIELLARFMRNHVPGSGTGEGDAGGVAAPAGPSVDGDAPAVDPAQGSADDSVP